MRLINFVRPGPLTTLRAGSFLVRLLPLSLALRLGYHLAAWLGPRLMPAKADQLGRHILRIDPDVEPDLAAEVRRGFGSYGRYWVESFRLPTLTAKQISSEFKVDHYEHISDVLEAGSAPILVLPHLGGWEWAAGWLSRYKGLGVAAVVERLEPEEVFEWFVSVRQGYGVNVIPLGSSAMGELIYHIKQGHIIALMADRDVAGTGVDVEFFGEATKLPVGPALLSRRTGAPLLPTAVFYDGWGYRAEVGEPIYPNWGSNLRADLATVTQELAGHLEDLIRQAPDQWHVLEPNWPSDYD